MEISKKYAKLETEILYLKNVNENLSNFNQKLQNKVFCLNKKIIIIFFYIFRSVHY